jgi:undecaprenyl-diphosphatase
VLQAIVWGLVQGITEFLPISSDGHLVLIPALLGLEPPDLATTAVLHLGTLLAVVTYFRADLLRMLRFRSDPGASRMLLLIVIGTVPAAGALLLEGPIERLQAIAWVAAALLIVNGFILLVGSRLTSGRTHLEKARPLDAFLVGLVQLVALLPGISRSGTTITVGEARGLTPVEAARFSFLLGIPTIAAAGLFGVVDLANDGGISSQVWVGMVVAAISGYFAIALLLRALQTVGLLPFAIYCFVFGTYALIVLL